MSSNITIPRLVAVLAETFNREASEITFQAYETALYDIPQDGLELAMGRALRECRFMPSPAELRELAGELSLAQRAQQAASIAIEAIDTLGPYKHVDFDDRVINATIWSMGKWPEFCARAVGADKTKWLRNDFVKAYTLLAQRGVDGEICRPLAGLSQATVGTLPDGTRGLVAPVPVRIACGLPELPAISHSRQLERVGVENVPHVELRKP